MFLKLRTVIYHVTSLEEAKKWYSNLLGIEPYFDMPFYVGFHINGSELGLDPDMTGIENGNHTYCLWSVENIDIVTEKIVALGGTVVQPKTNVGDGIFVAKLGDLWGNHIGLIQETH
jgi:predicted enzyme related to lactoylglutathione lyase